MNDARLQLDYMHQTVTILLLFKTGIDVLTLIQGVFLSSYNNKLHTVCLIKQ